MGKKRRRRWVQEGEGEVSMGRRRRRGQELGGGGKKLDHLPGSTTTSLHFDPPGWSSGDREEGSKR